jgi:hypothetical protein
MADLLIGRLRATTRKGHMLHHVQKRRYAFEQCGMSRALRGGICAHPIKMKAVFSRMFQIINVVETCRIVRNKLKIESVAIDKIRDT